MSTERSTPSAVDLGMIHATLQLRLLRQGRPIEAKPVAARYRIVQPPTRRPASVAAVTAPPAPAPVPLSRRSRLPLVGLLAFILVFGVAALPPLRAPGPQPPSATGAAAVAKPSASPSPAAVAKPAIASPTVMPTLAPGTYWVRTRGPNIAKFLRPTMPPPGDSPTLQSGPCILVAIGQTEIYLRVSNPFSTASSTSFQKVFWIRKIDAIDVPNVPRQPGPKPTNVDCADAIYED